jgi:hypothetical protein
VEISRACHVSHTFVNRIRRELKSAEGERISEEKRKVERGDQEYEMEVGRIGDVTIIGTNMRCSAYLFICGVQEYAVSVAKTPRNSRKQRQFTPHILGRPRPGKRVEKDQSELKSKTNDPILRESAQFSSC